MCDTNIEAMSIKEFYESFSELSSPEPVGTANGLDLPYKPRCEPRNSISTLTGEETSCSSNFESSQSPKIIQDNSFLIKDSYSPENEVFSAYQPIESSQRLNNGTKKFNSRWENILNSFESINSLPYCQPSASVEVPVRSTTQHLCSKSFRKKHISKNPENTNSFSCPPQHGDDAFTHQFAPKSIFNDTNPLPICQVSANNKTIANQHSPLGNIFINIGNTSYNQDAAPRQAFINQCKPDMKENYKVQSDPPFMDTAVKENYYNRKGNEFYDVKDNHSLPKISSNQYDLNMDQNHYITNGQETTNEYEQAINISEAIKNIRFKQFNNMNRYIGTALTNPSININNINSINVHVHQPGNILSSSESVVGQSHSAPVAQRVVPQMLPHYTSNDIWSNGQVANFQSLYPNNFLGGPGNSCQSEHSRYYGGLPDHTTKDDIYLPTSDESCASTDIDDLLNTIQLTPLEQYHDFNSVLKSERARKKRSRTTINSQTIQILQRWFDIEPYPSHNEQQIISEETGHTVDTVRIWFQNRRQLVKKRRLEALYKKNTAHKHPSTVENQDKQKLDWQPILTTRPDNVSMYYPVQVESIPTYQHQHFT